MPMLHPSSASIMIIISIGHLFFSLTHKDLSGPVCLPARQCRAGSGQPSSRGKTAASPESGP